MKIKIIYWQYSDKSNNPEFLMSFLEEDFKIAQMVFEISTVLSDNNKDIFIREVDVFDSGDNNNSLIEKLNNK